MHKININFHCHFLTFFVCVFFFCTFWLDFCFIFFAAFVYFIFIAFSKSNKIALTLLGINKTLTKKKIKAEEEITRFYLYLKIFIIFFKALKWKSFKMQKIMWISDFRIIFTHLSINEYKNIPTLLKYTKKRGKTHTKSV